MYWKKLWIVIIVLISFGCSSGGGSGGGDSGLAEPDGRRLRAIVEDRFSPHNIIIGGTTGAYCGAVADRPFSTNTCLILDREFNYVTPENDFKQWDIHPDNTNYWNWTIADLWIDHIADNNQILRIHGPIGPQVSHWAKDDIRTPLELETNMKAFMKALCQRYNGIEGIEYMDVVNETVEWGGWHKDKAGYDWECPWYIIGQDNDVNQTPLYIKMAFEIATQHAPDIKLIYNHHERPEMTFSWNLIKDTVLYLRDMGLRVDGIGWQAHVEAGYEEGGLQELRELIDWSHDNQLEFHITEASVWLYDGNSQENLEKQAKTYSAILDVLLEKRLTGKVGWNIWHIDDGHGWHTEWYPSMFDENYKPKPAYYAVQETLEYFEDE